MRLHVFSTTVFLLSGAALADPVVAQNPRVFSAPSTRILRIGGDDQPRSALGLSTSASTSARDTLGLLVSSVLPNSPAEKAGIEEGNRISSINGVNLRVAPPDIGDFDVSSAMSHRLTRELNKVHPGDEVDLRVYAAGQTRTVHVRTMDSDSVYARRRLTRNEIDDRPTLGFGIGATNTRRDTLGVLVMFVDDSGPAARAGLEEGNRIAEIEGVDLRVGREDAGDDYVANAKVRRLQREIAKLHPGDDVELRVYSSGQFRTVHIKAVRASDLPHRHGTFMITGEGLGILSSPFIPEFDGALIGGQVRGAIERAMENAGRALEGVGRGFERGRVFWQDDEMPDEAPRWEPMEPVHVEPLEPSRLRMTAPKVTFRSALLGDGDLAAAMATDVAMRNASGAADAAGMAIDIAGLRMVPVGSELAAYLGKGSERGLLVIEVPEWARGVVQAGDVVLSVEGRDVRTDSDEVTVELPRMRDAQLDILRDGVHHSVTLPARR
jgi:S1-C subfamily serine protease